MTKIKTQEDVFILVNTFYKNIRKDLLLGPIFNSNIPDDEWINHIDKLTNFWITILFGIPVFKGNPGMKHLKVDESSNHQIEQVHFEHWLYLWETTIDSLFNCHLSRKAKFMAKNIAEKQLILILKKRNKYL